MYLVEEDYSNSEDADVSNNILAGAYNAPEDGEGFVSEAEMEQIES